MFMTDLWYMNRNDFRRFETLKCPEIYTKLCPEISLLSAVTPELVVVVFTLHMSLSCILLLIGCTET